MINLKGRSFLTLLDYTLEEIRHLLNLSHQLKKDKKAGKITRRFEGMNLALIFEKRSTRTRCSFETAFAEEGGHPVFLSTTDIQLGEKETVVDTAKVLGGMFEAIEFRGYEQKAVETLAKESGVPVYNGLTDEFHPTQILADLLTVEEVFGTLENKKIVFVGDGRNNVAISLMIGCAKMGVDFSIAAPPSLFPSNEMIQTVEAIAQKSGATICITDQIEKAVDQADVLYTDVWTSMGEEEQAAQRESLLRPFQVNETMMRMTGKKETIFMHCLPAVIGKEVTKELFYSEASKVFQEAENRKYTIKAVMVATLCGE